MSNQPNQDANVQLLLWAENMACSNGPLRGVRARPQTKGFEYVRRTFTWWDAYKPLVVPLGYGLVFSSPLIVALVVLLIR